MRLRLRLQESLFLDAPPRPPLTPARAAAGLALAAVGVVAICLRLGFSTSFHSLWAEDGTILLETAARHDFLTSAGTLYVGNVILVPRLVGEIVAAAPLSWAPAIFTIAGNAIVVGCAFLAPLISPYDPVRQRLTEALQGPSSAHLLGTDENGRDILARVIYGSRVSLQAGVISGARVS